MAKPKGFTPAIRLLREDFLRWQCRLRQMAMREDGGRPSPGMRATIYAESGAILASGIAMLIHKSEKPGAGRKSTSPLAETTALFRHQALKTQDPVERWEKAVEHMAAGYFQQAVNFGDTLTALFAAPHALGACDLVFAEYGQGYRLHCRAELLVPGSALYDATYWHNFLFNPRLPEDPTILAYRPDWRKSGRLSPAV